MANQKLWRKRRLRGNAVWKPEVRKRKWKRKEEKRREAPVHHPFTLFFIFLHCLSPSQNLGVCLPSCLVYLPFSMIPSLMPGIRSHHAESTCLGSVLPQEFSLASYEEHCFNWQMLRQDGVKQTAGERKHKKEGEETDNPSERVCWQIHKKHEQAEYYEIKVFRCKTGRWEILYKRRDQMKESLSLHPVAWAVSVAETMTQPWLGTGCLCGGQGSAERWKGHHGTEEEGVGGGIKMRATNFQIQGTLFGGQELEPE